VQIFARSEKDIPEWAKHYHDWEATTDVSKLKVRLEAPSDFISYICSITIQIRVSIIREFVYSYLCFINKLQTEEILVTGSETLGEVYSIIFIHPVENFGVRSDKNTILAIVFEL